MLLYLQASSLICLSFLDASKSHDTPWSETKGFLLFMAITVVTVPVYSHASSQAPSPKPPGRCEERQVTDDMNTLSRLCYRNEEATKPYSGCSKNEAVIVLVHKKCQNERAPWNCRFGNMFSSADDRAASTSENCTLWEKYKGNRNKENKNLVLKGAKYGSLKTMNYINTHRFKFKRPTEK